MQETQPEKSCCRRWGNVPHLSVSLVNGEELVASRLSLVEQIGGPSQLLCTWMAPSGTQFASSVRLGLVKGVEVHSTTSGPGEKLEAPVAAAGLTSAGQGASPALPCGWKPELR